MRRPSVALSKSATDNPPLRFAAGLNGERRWLRRACRRERRAGRLRYRLSGWDDVRDGAWGLDRREGSRRAENRRGRILRFQISDRRAGDT